MKKQATTLFIFLLFCLTGNSQELKPGEPLPSWTPGYLDIHHINTGRGNASFCIFPDGTTLLIDAGEISPLEPRLFSPRNASIKPNYTRKPFEWIIHYILKVKPDCQTQGIDYALLTHFHDDHFGADYPGAPLSASGKFGLSGITGIGERLPIHLLLDRGFPTYRYPYDMKRESEKYGGGEIEFGQTMRNYFSFQQFQQQSGHQIDSLRAGSRTQIHLNNKPDQYPGFFVQNIKSNQFIWTGKDSAVQDVFPAYQANDRNSWPDENSLSLALTIHYGPFIYYTGGDNPGNVFAGDKPWRDVETPMAKAIGEVDIATMDHHGNRDAVNEFQVRTFKPTVWIEQVWSSDHPGHEVLIRASSPHLYPGKRDLFSTNMLEANKNVIGPLIDRVYKSQQGHILVRVLPGGEKYLLIILDDSTPEMPVKAVFGPYDSKIKPKK